jgi:WD40 repeat protein
LRLASILLALKRHANGFRGLKPPLLHCSILRATHGLRGHMIQPWHLRLSQLSIALALLSASYACDRAGDGWKSAASFDAGVGGVRQVAVSDSGSLIAVAGMDKRVALWDLATSTRRLELTVDAISLDLDSTGTTLAVGDDAGVISLYDMRGKETVAYLQGHDGRVHAVSFSMDDRFLASASHDGTARIWDLSTCGSTHVLSHEGVSVKAAVFSPDGAILATADDAGFIRLWDAQTGTCLTTLGRHRKWAGALAFSPDGQLLASGGFRDQIRVWDVGAGGLAVALGDPSAYVWSLAFAPNGRWLASAGDDKAVTLWNTEKWKRVETFPAQRALVTSVVFRKRAPQLISGCHDGWVRLWERE